MKLKLADLVIDPTIQIRRSNHEPTIRRYEEAFEKLPPVVVFDTDEGRILADGFHRAAAAERLGQTTIQAKVHKGTREDAAEFAVIANTKNADPLLPEERDDGIRRLKQLHPDWSQQQLADAMSVSKRTVRRVFETDKVKRKVIVTGSLSESHYAEVAGAKEEHWEPLLEAASERDWDRDTTRLARQNLEDKGVPQKHKRELLAGKADPVVPTPEGEFAVPRGVVTRRVRDMESNDAMLAFQRALEALAKARMFRAKSVLEPADRDTLKHWTKELPDDIAFLEEVLDGAGGRQKLRAVK